MNTMDFTKKMYKLDSDNMFIIENTLEDVVMENAKETTSPRGVEPVFYVAKYDDEYEVRAWTHNGNSVHVDYFDTEEDANQARLQYLYEEIMSDCSDRYFEFSRWFDSEEEAIKDYYDYIKEEDEDITIENIKGKIEAMRLDIENGKKTVARRLESEMKQAYDFWKANGQITKKAHKLISNIQYDGYRHDNIWELYIRHRDIATEETMRMINEMTK